MAPVFVLIILAFLILCFVVFKKPRKKKILPSGYQELLAGNVPYYNRLDGKNKARFIEKIKEFLATVHIEGVDTPVEDIDQLLIASSAVIPIFGFSQWTYYNLKNVLLYPASFNKDEFLASGYEKNTLGMIGNGPMQRIMILSKPALRWGFQLDPPRENTGIHEFVHLLDKEDGEVDGFPQALLNRKFNSRWLKLMSDNIVSILTGLSDINYYGASNKAEFFAVTSEYFFNCPEIFKETHPELFEMMCTIFNQNPIQPSYPEMKAIAPHQ